MRARSEIHTDSIGFKAQIVALKRAWQRYGRADAGCPRPAIAYGSDLD